MITLYSHKSAPNGWKIAIVLEILGIPYENKFLSFDTAEQKADDFTKVNPNGRIPAIVDHDNGDFALWESGAIVQYLVDRYDKEHKISYAPGTKEYALVSQWIAFQISGQGPYYGQAAWFARYHPEKIPSAIERYQKEIDRVVSVLDKAVSTQKYLVGDKLTIADLIFVPWNVIASPLLTGSSFSLDKYENYKRWNDDLQALPAVKKCSAQRAELLAADQK